MIIFRSSSLKDIEFALENGVWQAPVNVKEGVTVGEPVAIQLTKTNKETDDPRLAGKIFLVGIATSEMYDEVNFAWPGDKRGFTKTVKFDPIELKGQQPHKKI